MRKALPDEGRDLMQDFSAVERRSGVLALAFDDPQTRAGWHFTHLYFARTECCPGLSPEPTNEHFFYGSKPCSSSTNYENVNVRLGRFPQRAGTSCWLGTPTCGRGAAWLFAQLALLAACLSFAAPADADTTRKARFGKTITLTGNSGEKVQVRPLRLIDPVPPASEFETPKDGYRYVGVELRLRNIGRRQYTDTPSNGAHLITTAGRTVDATVFVGDACETTGRLRVPRGQSRVTCVTFEVPESSGLRYFEFTMNSGFADMTGQWRGLR